ncbi:MAG TPA: dihydrofolate reductase family protein [Acidimicrobiales bacterium]|nr:dihydrofolate reductase family protein [Acidimicrobiales bacterium]
MRELWPSPTDGIDPVAAYAADDRPAPDGRPWVLTNMIASVDGAATDSGGRSGGLGGPGDRAVFGAIRGVADLVLAGVGTVVAEDYGPARLPPEVQEQRAARGQAPLPRIAVVTASLRIEPDRRVFRDAVPDVRPLILTVARADAGRRRALAEVADVVEVGDEQVDWSLALGTLWSEWGVRVLLCEGGPSTNARLVAEDVLDEVCLTLAPWLIGDAAARIAQGPAEGRFDRMRMTRVLEDDGYLFLRHVRDRSVVD